MRHQHWYKYVVRYRAIRDWLNEAAPSGEDVFPVYDLSNHYGVRESEWFRLRKCFFKTEPTVVYAVMAAAALLARTWV